MREYNRSSRGGRDSGRRSFGGRGRSERPEMFKATCDQCGKECEVPFRPSGNKPVYCSECFEDKRDDGGSRNNRGRYESRDRHSRDGYREERQMFSVVCDNCGEECEVPFKPSSNKPVLCDKCFSEKKNKGSNNSGSNTELKSQIEELNNKLDKIISILEPVKEVKEAKKSIEKEVKKVVKEVEKTAKKVVKKAKAVKEDIIEEA